MQYTPRNPNGTAGTPQTITSSSNTASPIITQGQSFTDTAGRTGIVNYDTQTGAKLATGGTTANPYSTQSTTTLSSDKSKDILNTQNGIQQMSDGRGVTTNPDTGVSTYANNAVYDTADTSAEDDNISSIIKGMMQRTDADTADSLQSIQNKYSLLKQQQAKVNTAGEAATQGALFRSGAAQGDAYANNTQNYQVQQGLQLMQSLDMEQEDALAAARVAGNANKNRVAELMLQQAKDIKERKQAVADKVNEQLLAQKKATDEAKAIADKEQATIDLYNQGITDPGQITQSLLKAGYPATLKEVNDNVALLSGIGGTGIVGEYNFYKSQAKAAGQKPVDFNTYQNMDANRKVSIAKAAGVGASSVSDALLTAINGGLIDPNRINSRTIGLYNDIAKAGVDAVGAHAGAAGETKAITDLATYKSTAVRTLGVLESNLPLVENLADKVNTIGSPVLDSYISGKKALLTNDPNVIKYVNSLKTLRAEYAQMLAKGNATTESDKAEAAQAIPAGLSSAGYAALGQQLKLEANNILKASDDAIAAAKSKSFSNTGGTGADLLQQGQNNPLNLDTGSQDINNPLGL